MSGLLSTLPGGRPQRTSASAHKIACRSEVSVHPHPDRQALTSVSTRCPFPPDTDAAVLLPGLGGGTTTHLQPIESLGPMPRHRDLLPPTFVQAWSSEAEGQHPRRSPLPAGVLSPSRSCVSQIREA